MSGRPLLAWRGLETGESTGGIVFARRHSTALGFAASEFNNGETDDIELSRAPQFDHLAPGPVPDELLFEDGWHFECAYPICCHRASLDYGGVARADGIYCEEHADPYQWYGLDPPRQSREFSDPYRWRTV